MFWRVGAKRYPFPWKMQNALNFVKILGFFEFHGIYVKFAVSNDKAELVDQKAQILKIHA